LIEVKNTGGTIATYAYDYQSRRISKDVTGVITNFVYDGWNPIAEFSGTALSKSYVWGMDLSGSMQGAGGVGGLLAVAEGATTHYPIYDGNGNVSEYVDSTGTVVAHYEYDAFGQAVASGTKANNFSHQFSTKQLDVETGLNYYGLRFFDSANGRWLNRDPLSEDAGINIYSFTNNDCVRGIDYLGLHVYYVYYYIKSGNDTFKRGAETQKREIESRSDFDPKCDRVEMIPVTYKADFLKKWKEMVKESKKGGDDTIGDLYLFLHGGIGGKIEFLGAGNTVAGAEVDKLPKGEFDRHSEIHCKNCDSGVRVGKADSLAERMRDQQDAKTYGQDGLSYPSNDPDKRESGNLVDDGDGQKDVYWGAYGKGGRRWNSEGADRPDVVFEVNDW